MIGESATPSRSGTPKPTVEKEQTSPGEASADGGHEGNEEQPQGKITINDTAPPELPPDIRVKLRKLDKLESKYHGLFKLYWS